MSEINKNADPLTDLITRHKAVMGRNEPEPVIESSSVGETTPIPNTISNEDFYGDDDFANQIAEEEKQSQVERETALKEKEAERKEAASFKIFNPPNEKDMSYNEQAIGYQSEKLSIVTTMVQKVVAKYRMISGGIPEAPVVDNNGYTVSLGQMAVKGELIDIYHNSGEKITPEFEDIILNNWIMPDGTKAIDNINDDGIVIDKLMFSQPTEAANTSNGNTANSDNNSEPVELKPDVPTINIQVEQNTPVTVNIDDSVVQNLATGNEINIVVKEVSQEEMMKTTIVENSAEEGIIIPYDSGINDTPITLPLSGYRCVMRAINWFDFIKLTAPSSNNSPDNELKRWSVIYEHMKNVSIGPFKDFDDFLKKTKYYDRELLMWGLLVATADDEENLSITCGNPKCKYNIRIPYHPRTIVKLDESKIPKWYNRVHEASYGEDAIKIFNEVNTKKVRYKLPHTGIIVETNEPSAYEFITEKIPMVQELYKKYREDDMTNLAPDDPALAEFEYLSANIMYVKSFSFIKNDENGKPKEYLYTNWDDMERIITKSLDVVDSSVLVKIIEKSRENASPVTFRVENVNCPKCARHEPFIPVTDIGGTLLFQVSRRLSNTQINLIEMD